MTYILLATMCLVLFTLGLDRLLKTAHRMGRDEGLRFARKEYQERQEKDMQVEEIKRLFPDVQICNSEAELLEHMKRMTTRN